MTESKSQLVIQTAFLGDLILSIPLFQEIKKQFPKDKLILVCKSGLGDFFLKEKIIDQVYEVKKNDRGSYKKIISQLNDLNIENLFCIHRSMRSQLTSLQIKAQRKIGFKSWLGFFIFKDQVVFESSWPEALRQLKILTPINDDIKSRLAEKNWHFLNQPDGKGHLPPIPSTLRPLIENQMEKSQTGQLKKKVALFPGSVWATKKWTMEGYASVANSFLAEGFQVYLMGGPDEKDLCLSIQKLSLASEVLAGRLSIVQSIDFIKSCAAVIANDSAPTHMAASQNIPVVSIFGPTTLDFGFRPWSSNAVIVENNNLNCRPCGKHGPQVCPLGHHHCMKHIEPATVFQAALNLISNSNSL